MKPGVIKVTVSQISIICDCFPTTRSEFKDFPGGPVNSDSVLPIQGAQVQSLVGKLRSHKPSSVGQEKKGSPPKMKVSEHMLCKIIVDLCAYLLIEKLERMFTFFLEKII